MYRIIMQIKYKTKIINLVHQSQNLESQHFTTLLFNFVHHE